MRRVWVFLLVAAAAMAGAPARAEVGTYGVSGYAVLSDNSFLRLRISGITEGGRQAIGTGEFNAASLVFTCARGGQEPDGRWTTTAYGSGVDGNGYAVHLSLGPDGEMLDLRVTEGLPGNCNITDPVRVYTGVAGEFFAREAGAARLTGLGGFGSGAGRVQVGVDLTTLFTQGAGEVWLTYGGVEVGDLDVLCVWVGGATMRRDWYTIVGVSDGGEVYEIFIEDARNGTLPSQDLLAVDRVAPADNPNVCGGSGSSAPRQLSTGNFVLSDPL